MELDKNTLKPEQIQKIAGRKDVEAQIKKNQQFALLYKSIVDESGATSFDSKEDITKIANLLAVGFFIDKNQNLGEDKDLAEVYT